MTARHRVARAHLRAQSQRQNNIASSLNELRSAKVALFAANACITAGLHAQMVGPDEVYELLNSVFDRLDRAISQLDIAVTGKGGVA
jgi:hypothetical protein